jgi:hypothetical protein
MDARAYNQSALWRHFSSFVPHSRNYGGQAGRDLLYSNPGLKPWAILLCHFMARSHGRPFCTSRLSSGPQAISGLGPAGK